LVRVWTWTSGKSLFMKIGILGSSDRAVAIGRLLASGGHAISIADPANPSRAQTAANGAGWQYEIPYRQAMTREVLIVATAPDQVDRCLKAIGAAPSAIVVDAVEGRGTNGRSGAERVAKEIDSHRVVRALIVLPQPGANVAICGDDEQAKLTVDRMFEAAGCTTTDRGSISLAHELESPGSVAA
jgi:predicted dinucleotide-binding enzyme